MTKVGPKIPLVLGLALLTGGMIFYAQIPTSGSYATALLPGYLLVGVGMPFAFIPVTIAALAGVGRDEAGLGSGPDHDVAADRRRRRRRRHLDRDRLAPRRAATDLPRR